MWCFGPRTSSLKTTTLSRRALGTAPFSPTCSCTCLSRGVSATHSIPHQQSFRLNHKHTIGIWHWHWHWHWHLHWRWHLLDEAIVGCFVFCVGKLVDADVGGFLPQLFPIGAEVVATRTGIVGTIKYYKSDGYMRLAYAGTSYPMLRLAACVFWIFIGRSFSLLRILCLPCQLQLLIG